MKVKTDNIGTSCKHRVFPPEAYKVAVIPPPAKQHDRINDAQQKEEALNKYVRRELVYQRLQEGLNAERVVIEYKDGIETERREPDKLIRHKYVETALKTFGDLKDRQEIELGYKISDKDRELLEKYGVIKRISNGVAAGDK